MPAVPSAMVNMYNVRSFLEDGVYKTTEQCKVGPEGRRRALSVCQSSLLPSSLSLA